MCWRGAPRVCPAPLRKRAPPPAAGLAPPPPPLNTSCSVIVSDADVATHHAIRQLAACAHHALASMQKGGSKALSHRLCQSGPPSHLALLQSHLGTSLRAIAKNLILSEL